MDAVLQSGLFRERRWTAWWEGAMYKSGRRSRKAARTVVFVVISVFVALASTAVVALVIVMSSDADACEPVHASSHLTQFSAMEALRAQKQTAGRGECRGSGS
jgi:hypothetical protein